MAQNIIWKINLFESNIHRNKTCGKFMNYSQHEQNVQSYFLNTRTLNEMIDLDWMDQLFIKLVITDKNITNVHYIWPISTLLTSNFTIPSGRLTTQLTIHKLSYISSFNCLNIYCNENNNTFFIFYKSNLKCPFIHSYILS